MVHKLFFETLRTFTDEEYFTCFATYLISPIITGIKPSSIINLTNNNRNMLNIWREKGKQFLFSLDLKYITLKQKENIETVLIYNRDNLVKVLSCKKIRSLLESYGYTNLDDIQSVLFHLKNRFRIEACPHEIGVFLGIPLHDVEDFINCKDKPCLLCRYWKVYSREEYSRELFRKYDISKELVVNYLLQGKNLKLLYNNFIHQISA